MPAPQKLELTAEMCRCFSGYFHLGPAAWITLTPALSQGERGPVVLFTYQFSRWGFWARQPSSDGKIVLIATRSMSPSNMCSTEERHFL